jgi:death-on-curing protein
MHTFSGTDLYPSVVQKAAVLLHGLARTQSFVDGNKRTAWLSCLTFLGDKDIRLIDADNVAADFVIALATGELDVLGAAEWILDRIQD